MQATEMKKTDNNELESKEIALQAVYDIPLKIKVVLGSTELKLNQVLRLTKGTVIELDKNVGDLVDLFIGNRLVARGEIVLVDNKVGMTLTELAKSDQLS